MQEQQIVINTDAGSMPVFSAVDDNTAGRPLVLMLMDALGIREELREAARRVAASGYQVLLPDLYYRHGDIGEINISDPDDFQRMLGYFRELSDTQVVADCDSLLNWADETLSAASTAIGAVGYCMGGAFVLALAAARPDRVRAVASIHPGNLVMPGKDSPRANISAIRARLYFAIADQDEYAPAEHVRILGNALEAQGLEYEMEVLEGALHGFTFPSMPSYQREASEHQWRKVLELFEAVLH